MGNRSIESEDGTFDVRSDYVSSMLLQLSNILILIRSADDVLTNICQQNGLTECGKTTELIEEGTISVDFFMGIDPIYQYKR